MNFTPVRKLTVWRTFSDGQQARVGGLAQNRQGVFFQYDADYLAQFSPLSPFTLKWNATVQQGTTRAPWWLARGICRFPA
ncbi:MAG: hypothetical protein MH219_20495 [Marinobacter sp.]|nr:hypothetical protein [Marinobacter sp.]